MKYLFLVLALLLPNIVKAEDTTLNFENVFHNTRVGMFVDQHFNKLNGVYAALVSLHGKDQLELVNLNVGYVQREDSRNASLVQTSLRFDTLIRRLAGSSWSLSHASFSQLPQIEFGPFYSVLVLKESDEIKFDKRFGVGLAIRL